GMRYTTEREFANSPGHFEELLPMAQLVDFIFDGTADGGEADEVFYPMTPAQRALLVATSIQWRLGLQGEGYGSLFDILVWWENAEIINARGYPYLYHARVLTSNARPPSPPFTKV
ncbi:MAG: hypothetical protein Q7U74_07110, partial [Saprospiraceae bacterium]|nr:hypothetical protein [Saprospiraceae bacterium]